MSVFSKTETSAKTPKHYIARKRYSDIWPLIKKLYREERRDIIVVFIYGIVASILGLVVPLSSQAIVNAVALGVHSEQLVVLCIVVLVAMLAMAIILIFQKHVIDYMQRRQFLVTAREMVDRLPRVQDGVYEDVYAPELANRFFDVVTVQKAMSKFLTDGVSAMLSIVTGFIVLAIYRNQGFG
jgi:ABC-type bacteriocin/lantibiotic exporter with double-glycine peptidase domain